MKKLIPVMLVIGLGMNACGPSEEEVQDAQEQIEAAAKDMMDDVTKKAAEAAEQLVDTAAAETADSAATEAGAGE